MCIIILEDQQTIETDKCIYIYMYFTELKFYKKDEREKYILREKNIER